MWNMRAKAQAPAEKTAGQTAEKTAGQAAENADKAAKKQEAKAEKKRKTGGVRTFLFALILGAVLALCAVRYFNAASAPDAPVITASTLKEELRYVKDLVTVEYRYTNADKAEFPGRVFFGQNIPFTGKSFIVSYDGVLKYGVDLSEVDIEVNQTTRVVIVTIPPSEIISHEIPESGFRALDERDGLFNRIHIDDVTEFRRAQKAAMEKKAVSMGMPRQAQEQAAAAIEALLSATPGMNDYYVNIRYT